MTTTILICILDFIDTKPSGEIWEFGIEMLNRTPCIYLVFGSGSWIMVAQHFVSALLTRPEPGDTALCPGPLNCCWA